MKKNKQDQGADTSSGSVPPCTPHDAEVLCSACTPVLRDFSIDDMARMVGVGLEKVVPELAVTSGIPVGLLMEAFTSIIFQDMVQTWKDRKFVQDASICQSCGTRKPHDYQHCLRVRVRMVGVGVQATLVEMSVLPLIDGMKSSVSDELRRKLLKVRQ